MLRTSIVKMWNFRIVFVLCSLCLLPVMSEVLCSSGYFLHNPLIGPDICLPCREGSFMSYHRHTNRACYKCTSIKHPFIESVVSRCNTTHDSIISCVAGYFRTKPEKPEDKPECHKCTTCTFPKRPCQSHSDTICCPGENDDVVPNEHGIPVCVKVCGRGQFLDLSTNTCSPCPAKTFMDAIRHPFIQCQKCRSPQNELEVVFKPCQRGSQTVIGCVGGYYRKIDENQSGGKCVKCKNCTENLHFDLYEVKKCDNFHDTICCPDHTMTVVDTPDGPRCQQSIPTASSQLATCGPGTYLSIDHTSKELTCLPCPPGTYTEHLTHIQTSCKNCSSYKRHNLPNTCATVMAKSESGDVTWATRDTIFIIITIMVIGLLILLIVRKWQAIRRLGFRHKRMHETSAENVALSEKTPEENANTGA